MSSDTKIQSDLLLPACLLKVDEGELLWLVIRPDRVWMVKFVQTAIPEESIGYFMRSRGGAISTECQWRLNWSSHL
jgi:hypothetical protein